MLIILYKYFKLDFEELILKTKLFSGLFCFYINVKMKMYKIADSKCTILSISLQIEYTLFGRNDT